MFTLPRLIGWLAATLLALWLTIAAPSAEAQETVTPSDRVTRNVVVRAEPSTSAAPVDKMLPGAILPLVGDVPGWFRVQLPNGQQGFVSKAWTDLSSARLATAGRTFKVHVIDVGTGLAIFIEGQDFALLYDAGSQDDLAQGPNNRVVAYIRKVRPDLKRLDHVILSHSHKDHQELMPDVFDAFQVANVWESGRVKQTAGYCKFLKKVVAEGAVYHDAIASNATRAVTFSGSSCKGTVTVIEGPMMTIAPVVLGVQAQMSLLYRDAQAYADPNGNSVVTRLDLGDKRILLTGDAEGGERESPSTAPRANSVEARLLACCKPELAADVLVVGHHGSLTSSRNAFIDAVGAKVFVISSGPYPYGSMTLPDKDIVSALEARGQVYRTDVKDAECGADPAKPGPDADESPGGCNNVLITIAPPRALTVAYVKPAD
ncbi:MBL fold metallo-hydrolase [Caulobacter segnis]